MWSHEDSKMKANYIRKSFYVLCLEDAVYKSLGLDPTKILIKYEIFPRAKFSNETPCYCTANMEIVIFIVK